MVTPEVDEGDDEGLGEWYNPNTVISVDGRGVSIATGVDIGSRRVKQLDGIAATQDSSLLYDKIRGVSTTAGVDSGVGRVSYADDTVTHKNCECNTNFMGKMRAPIYDEQESTLTEEA